MYGGSGLGRIDGRVVLVPYVLPQEQVDIEIRSERKSLVEARLARVVESSPDRVEAPCPYFRTCGGCHYQHIPYERQLIEKTAILRETFQRIGKFHLPGELQTVAAEPWAYRNRSQFHLDKGKIGYLQAGSHRLCPIDHCPISSPRINEALAAIIEMMRDSKFPRFLRSIEVFTNEEHVQLNVRESEKPLARWFFDWCAERVPGYASGSISYEAAGFPFRVGPSSFFQVNRFLVDAMVEAALTGVQGETALDLYAGAGLFTLPMARRFATVTAVEAGGGAHRDLEHNAGEAGLSIRAVHGASDAHLSLADQTPDFVLADPPRAGLGKRAVEHLLRLKPPQLVIVSCDPTTLARDAATLIAGGYKVQHATMIDLFPQTFHIETIVRLVI